MKRFEHLEPAVHVEEPPADGWTAAELDESELVDDQFIEANPDSYTLKPIKRGPDHGA